MKHERHVVAPVPKAEDPRAQLALNFHGFDLRSVHLGRSINSR
jgi:hypothetical protein